MAELTAAGIRRAAMFSPAKHADKIEQLYNVLAGRRPKLSDVATAQT